MKSLTQILFNALLLLNATTLIAQEPIRVQGTGCRGQEIEEGVINGRECNCIDNQFSDTNFLLSSSYLDVTPKLMMNPSSIEEGAKAMGEALGLFGKEAVAAEEAVVTGEGAGRSDMERAVGSSNSSHQVLRLRGGGPNPKNKLAGGLKSTGESSDEETDVNKFLEDEICNNIYTSCQIKVANLSRQAAMEAWTLDQKTLQEQREWQSAKEAAQQDLDTAKWKFKRAKEQFQQLEKNDPRYHDQSQLFRLTEVEVEKISADLYAITVHDNPSLIPQAVEKLNQAEQNKKTLQQQIEQENHQRTLDDLELIRNQLLNAEEGVEFLADQATQQNRSRHTKIQEKIALWDKTITEGEKITTSWEEFHQKVQEKAATSPQTYQAAWQEVLKPIKERQARWEELLNTWTNQKTALLQTHEQTLRTRQEQQAQERRGVAETLFHEAQNEENNATSFWNQLHHPQTPHDTLQFHSPTERALQAAKTTLQAWNNAKIAYEQGEEHPLLRDDDSWKGKERLAHINQQQRDWSEKISALAIDLPYQLDPVLEEFQQALARKSWKEEGATFEAFQTAAIARALAPKKEASAFERVRLQQELKDWNKNLAHQAENLKRWEAFQVYDQLQQQAKEARKQLKKLKRKERSELFQASEPLLEEDQEAAEIDSNEKTREAQPAIFIAPTASFATTAQVTHRTYYSKGEASTDTGSTLSTVSGIEAERLKKIIAEADTAEGRWIALVKQANNQRENYGGMIIPDYQTFCDTWEEADKAILQAEEQAVEEQEQQMRGERMKRNWDANKTRWQLLEEIVQETTKLTNLQTALDGLEEAQRPSQRQEREDKKKEINIQKLLLEEKNKNWEQQALQEPRLALHLQQFNDPQEREAAIKRASKRLEREDQFINTFKEQLISPKEEEFFENNNNNSNSNGNNNTNNSSNSNKGQKRTDYQFALKTNRAIILADYFQEINNERFQIQEMLSKNKTLEVKEEAKRRYNLIALKEQKVLQRYQLLSEEQAIDAALDTAFEVTTHTQETKKAWEERASQSQKIADRKEHERKHPNTLPWNNSFEESPHGTYLLAQADQAALKAYEQEEQYIKDVKKILEQELASADKLSFAKEETAAKTCDQENAMAWKRLSAQERRHYNDCLREKSQEQLSLIEKIIEGLLVHSVKAITELQDFNQSVFTIYTSKTKQKILHQAEEQEIELKRIITLLSEPHYQAALHRALEEASEEGEESAERVKQPQSLGFLFALGNETTTKIKYLLSQQQLAPLSPLAQGAQETQRDQASAYSAISPAIQKAHKDNQQQNQQTQDPNSLFLQDSHELLRCCMTLQEQLTQQIAIRNKSNIAPLEQKAAKSAEAAVIIHDEALEASGEAKYFLWDQAIAEAQRAALLWDRVVHAREEQLKSFNGSKKGDALYNLETAQDKRAFWETEGAKYESSKAQVIAIDTCQQAKSIDGEAAFPLWDQAIALCENINRLNEKYVALQQQRVATVVSRFQAAAKRDLEKNLSDQTIWKIPLWQACKAEVVANVTWEKQSFSPHELWSNNVALLPLVKRAAEARDLLISQYRELMDQAEERFKIDWKRSLAQSEHPARFWNLWGRVLELTSSSFSETAGKKATERVEEKMSEEARTRVEKREERESVWKDLLGAAQERIEARGALLEEGKIKRNFNYSNDLEILQNEKALADDHQAWCEAMYQGSKADEAYQEYQKQGKNELKGKLQNKPSKLKEKNNERADEKRTPLWKNVLETLEETVVKWDVSIEVAKRCLAEAPEAPTNRKPSWEKLVRRSKTQRALWEGRLAWWEAEKKEQEAREAIALLRNTTMTTAPQENPQLHDRETHQQIESQAKSVVAAWDRAFNFQWEQASHAPDYLKPLWIENRDLAKQKREEWEKVVQSGMVE